MRVEGRAADEAALGVEMGDAGLRAPGEHLLDLGHDLGANAVAGEEEEVVGRHGGSRGGFYDDGGLLAGGLGSGKGAANVAVHM